MTYNPEVICDSCLGREPSSKLVPTEPNLTAEALAIAKWIVLVLFVCAPMLIAAFMVAPILKALDRLRGDPRQYAGKEQKQV
jgi:hypothetical protein